MSSSPVRIADCPTTPAKVSSEAATEVSKAVSRTIYSLLGHAVNGLAMRDGNPAYVTAVSRSNTIDGWRDRRADGGVVIDVKSGEIVCSGLSMPHSPRWHDGRLYLHNSGSGEFGYVEFPEAGTGEGRFEPVAFCPGFLRGLTLKGKYAFVGLSRPRYKRFEGLPLDEKLKVADSEPWCGIQVPWSA